MDSFKIAEKAKFTSMINKDHFSRLIKKKNRPSELFITAISIPGRKNIFPPCAINLSKLFTPENIQMIEKS